MLCGRWAVAPKNETRAKSSFIVTLRAYMPFVPGSALRKSTKRTAHTNVDARAVLRVRAPHYEWIACALAVVITPLLVAPKADAQSRQIAPNRSTQPEQANQFASSNAELVLVGAPDGLRELASLCDELLTRQGVSVHVTHQDHYDADALFGDASRGMTRVFVVLRDPRRARLHFRGPSGERYLFRNVALPNGLDAVGRELVAQVVESAIVALLRTNAGMSREEANAELEREAEGNEAPPSSGDSAAKSVTSGEVPSPSRSTTRAPVKPASTSGRLGASPWEPRAAAHYDAMWSSDSVGFGHGLGLAAGLRFRRRGSAGVELGATRWFEQTLSTAAVRASIARTSCYALVEAGWSFTASHSAFVAAGPALGFVRVRPQSGAADVTLAAQQSSVLPALHVELRYEFSTAHGLFGAAARLDYELVKTRYELDAGRARELLAAPAPLSAGAALSVGFR